MREIPLAVVAALDDEIRIIRSKMDVDSQVHVRPALFTIGTYMHRPLLLVRSGMGLDAMGDAVRYCIERYDPSLCLHVGYCGGADPHYQAGDLLIAAAVVDGKSGERYESDKGAVDRAQEICRGRGMRARVGNLVTVDKVICQPHEKAFAGTQHDVHGIDMESAALVAACRARGAPHLVVRAVLDPLDVALPDMVDAVDEEGKMDGVALAGHVIRHPKYLLDLPRLEYFAAQARSSIAAFVDAWVEEGREGDSPE